MTTGAARERGESAGEGKKLVEEKNGKKEEKAEDMRASSGSPTKG